MDEPLPNSNYLERIVFRAEDVYFGQADHGVEVFTAAALFPEHGPLPHVVVMRSLEDLPASIHLDCNYPLYGGVYDAVARARISVAGLRLDLRADMPNQLRKLGGCDIAWSLPAEQYAHILRGLESLFRGTDILRVVADP